MHFYLCTEYSFYKMKMPSLSVWQEQTNWQLTDFTSHRRHFKGYSFFFFFSCSLHVLVFFSFFFSFRGLTSTIRNFKFCNVSKRWKHIIFSTLWAWIFLGFVGWALMNNFPHQCERCKKFHQSCLQCVFFFPSRLTETVVRTGEYKAYRYEKWSDWSIINFNGTLHTALVCAYWFPV